MKEKSSSTNVPEAKLRQLTEAAENGQYGVLSKFLNSLPNAVDRVEVLQSIERLNRENRYKTGKLPRLAFVSNTYIDSDFVDIALTKKSSDWLFQDDVLYRESIIWDICAAAEITSQTERQINHSVAHSFHQQIARSA
ncbi:MAG: hypothetical protein WCT03_12540 [Candidatus Obscuribacterales bacterium]